MANVLDDLHTLLTGLFPAETIKKGFLPTDPDRVTALVERFGEEPPAETFVGKGKGPKLNMELPNIQLLIRTVEDSYEDSRNLAESFYRARYAAIEVNHPPFNIGIDEQGRWLMGFTIRCWKRPN